MPASLLLLLVAGLSLIGWTAGVARGRGLPAVAGSPVRPLPGPFGWYVGAWVAAPPLLFLSLWAVLSPALVTDTVLATPAAVQLPTSGFQRATLLAEARALGAGESADAFHPIARALAPAYAAAQARYDALATAAVLALALAGGAWAAARVRPGFAAAPHVERMVAALLLAAALAALLTTAGIAASLLWESARFFGHVSAADFLFGTRWSPGAVDPADPGASLGAVPLFWGTFLTGGVIAMGVAVPLGLMSAIYLTQYAAPSTRRRLKPLLEVLAGVPSVVYGYFAALTVAPAVRRLGLAMGIADASAESALAAGLVMGVMIIPLVSSVTDDSLAAVSAEMRDASLALGATRSETVMQVLLPAALPGVMAGVLLAVSRAVGETMIAVMAASGAASLSANPFRGATTVTRQVVDLLTGEAVFDSPKTLAAFALGLTLFVATLLMNVAALGIVKRHRDRYA